MSVSASARKFKANFLAVPMSPARRKITPKTQEGVHLKDSLHEVEQ
jgi:hypothetical protein